MNTNTRPSPDLAAALTALAWVCDHSDTWMAQVTETAANLRRRLLALQAGDQVDAADLAAAIDSALALQEAVDVLDGARDDVDNSLANLPG